MIVAFGLELGYCLVYFHCSRLLSLGIEYYMRRKVFGSLRVYFICLFGIGWFYFIHRMMGHCARSVFAPPGM
jgi:hypothetical protein